MPNFKSQLFYSKAEHLVIDGSEIQKELQTPEGDVSVHAAMITFKGGFYEAKNAKEIAVITRSTAYKQGKVREITEEERSQIAKAKAAKVFNPNAGPAAAQEKHENESAKVASELGYKDVDNDDDFADDNLSPEEMAAVKESVGK